MSAFTSRSSAVGEEVPGAIGRIAAVDLHRAQRLHAFAAGRGLIDPTAIDEQKVFFALATAIRMLLVTATVDRAPHSSSSTGNARRVGRNARRVSAASPKREISHLH